MLSLPARVHADRSMALETCLESALRSNPSIQIAQLDPLLAEADYLAAQGVFDPTVFLNYTFSDRVDPLDQRTVLAVRGVVASVISRTPVLTGGIGGATAVGTQYTITFQSTRNDSTINEGFGTEGEYEMDLTGEVTQPLLRNFGIATNTAGVRVAKLERQAAAARLRETLIATLFEVEQAYWQLVLAQDALAVQRNGLALATKLLEDTRTRLEVGVVAPLAVLEAETGVARREEGVLLARQAVGDAQDGLLRLLASSASRAEWREPIQATDPPGLELVAPDVDAVMAEALRARPELIQLRIGTAQAGLQTAYEKNQRLPELNVLGEYGFASTELSLEDALDEIGRGRNPHWLLGLEMTIPWGNREARGAYRRARLTEMSTRRQLRNVEQVIVQDARQAVREVSTGFERVQTTRVAEHLAREQLAAEEAKLAVGVATPFDVRQRQDALIEQQGRALEALVGYRLAVANLARARGAYLERLGLSVMVGGRSTAPDTTPILTK